jgi:hypothetical protein
MATLLAVRSALVMFSLIGLGFVAGVLMCGQRGLDIVEVRQFRFDLLGLGAVFSRGGDRLGLFRHGLGWRQPYCGWRGWLWGMGQRRF